MIEDAVEFTNAAVAQIAIAVALNGIDCWESDSLTKVRKEIRDHYVKTQKFLCCYCRKELVTYSAKTWEIEHILPQSIYPQFTFCPRNLSAACSDCNNFKSHTNPTNYLYKKFPTKSKQYKIVHPHFDKYSDHIQFGDYTYIGHTPKGSYTIKTCNLFRFWERAAGVKNSVRDHRFESIVDKIRTSKDMNEAESLLNFLKSVLQQNLSGIGSANTV